MGACGQVCSECGEISIEMVDRCLFFPNDEHSLPDIIEDEDNNTNKSDDFIDYTKLIEKELGGETYVKLKKRKKEKEESKKYMENLDKKELFNNFDSIMKEIISEEFLVDIELSDEEKQKERIQNIQKISNDLSQEKTQDEFISQLMDLNATMKESICYQIHHEPENFVRKDEINTDTNPDLFIQGVFSSFLEQKGVQNVIQKNTGNEENASKLALQLIFNGEAFNQIIHFHISYGEENDQIILNDEEVQKQFILDKKINYAKILNKNPDDIIFSKIREGGLSDDVYVKNSNPDELKQHTNELEEYEKKQGAKIYGINFECLLNFCNISPSMFDHNYDQLNDGWGRNQKRGPPGYLMDYDPPIGYKGYALKVAGQYDNGNDTWLGMDNVEGEWYIAYHGTSGNVVKPIMD